MTYIGFLFIISLEYFRKVLVVVQVKGHTIHFSWSAISYQIIQFNVARHFLLIDVF